MREYMQDLARYPLLTAQEEHDLFVAYKERGDVVARERIVCCNLRLVVHEAKYFHKVAGELEELVAAGNCGLVIAVDRFDLAHDCRFSTYATHWIRYYIRDAMCRRSVIHVPSYATNKSPVMEELPDVMDRPHTSHDNEAFDQLVTRVMQVGGKRGGKMLMLRIEGLTLKEIGRKYRITKEAVRQQINRVKRDLKTLLQEDGPWR